MERGMVGGAEQRGTRSSSLLPTACLRPPCRAQGTPLPSGQLQLVTHLNPELGGERNKSRTWRGIFFQGDAEEWGGDGGLLMFLPAPDSAVQSRQEGAGRGLEE